MNYSYFLNLMLIILTITITCASNSNTYNRLRRQKSQRKTLIESLSHRIIKYFDINKYLSTRNEETYRTAYNTKNDKKCDSIEEINNYFFNVYGENNTINRIDLNNMIKFQITGLKEEDIEKKTKRKSCRRKEVYKLVGLFFLNFYWS
jgi:hypothetical protein